MFISKNITKQPRLRLGFTLIELLVVIVIIGVLATLTTISLTSARGKARDARRISDLKQIATALELYQADNNSYPTFITGGNTLVNPNDASKVYMKKVPSDPSTNTSYAYYGSTSRFTLRTTIEKSVDNIPVGPVIITSGGGVKQALNTDNSYMNPDLTFGALVGHWMLDGATGTSDLSGYGNNGTIMSAGVVTSTGSFGEALGSYYFSDKGENTYVNLGNSPTLRPTTGFTISAWVKVAADNNLYTIVSRGAINSNSSSYTLFYDARFPATATPMRFNLEVGCTTTVNSGGRVFFTIRNTEPWYHFVGTYSDATKTAQVYVNGLGGTPNINNTCGAMPANTNNTLIGKSASYAPTTENYIKDVRIYSRALDAYEISQLYNATRP